jgi:hypothetical protein
MSELALVNGRHQPGSRRLALGSLVMNPTILVTTSPCISRTMDIRSKRRMGLRGAGGCPTSWWHKKKKKKRVEIMIEYKMKHILSYMK